MALLSFSFIKLGIEISPVLPSKVGLELTQKIREAICYNQGKYIEFEFMSGNKHKALKTALNEGASVDEINRKYFDLVNYIGKKIEDISKKILNI